MISNPAFDLGLLRRYDRPGPRYSDAEAVLREASIPVLLVRASTDSKASKRQKVQPSEEEAIRLPVVSPAS
jgi:hypothetical protein